MAKYRLRSMSLMSPLRASKKVEKHWIMWQIPMGSRSCTTAVDLTRPQSTLHDCWWRPRTNTDRRILLPSEIIICKFASQKEGFRNCYIKMYKLSNKHDLISVYLLYWILTVNLLDHVWIYSFFTPCQSRKTLYMLN